MKKFYKKVDLRSKAKMRYFLCMHFRYHTMSSWNCSTSYANCVKVHRLGLTLEQEDRALEMTDIRSAYYGVNRVLNAWGRAQDWRWQIGTNGRSGGYFVLLQGGLDHKNAVKARCDECGKHTYHTKDTPCTTSGCDGTIVVLGKPAPQIVTYPAKSLDQGEDFEDWDIYQLRDRVKLVQSFDKACDEAVAEFVAVVDSCRVVEKEIFVPHTVRVLEPA